MKDKKITDLGKDSTNGKETIPNENRITVPRQKTLVGETADQLDDIANKWLHDRARKKEPPPMIGKAGSCNGNYFVVYYWFESISEPMSVLLNKLAE